MGSYLYNTNFIRFWVYLSIPCTFIVMGDHVLGEVFYDFVNTRTDLKHWLLFAIEISIVIFYCYLIYYSTRLFDKHWLLRLVVLLLFAPAIFVTIGFFINDINWQIYYFTRDSGGEYFKDFDTYSTVLMAISSTAYVSITYNNLRWYFSKNRWQFASTDLKKSFSIGALIIISVAIFTVAEDWYQDYKHDNQVRSMFYIDRSDTYFTDSKMDTVESKDISVRTLTTSIDYGVSDLFFLNKNDGVAVGCSGLKISITNSGGRQWNNTRYSRFANCFRAVDFFDSMNGIAVGSNRIFLTNNSGKDWRVFPLKYKVKEFKEKLKYKFFDYYDVDMVNKDIAYVAGKSSTLLKTQDGGNTWKLLELDLPKNIVLRKVHFINKNEGWVVGSEGVILHTVDGGVTWKIQRHKSNSHFVSLFVADKSAIHVGGQGILLRSKDSGKTWVDYPINSTVTSIFFDSTRSGGYVTQAGGLYITKNAGEDYTKYDLPVPHGGFWSLQLSSPDHGWIAAQGGEIYEFTLKSQE